MTGELQMIYWLPDPAKLPSVRLGDLVTVQARLGVYQDVLNITVDEFRILGFDVDVETDPNVELLHWTTVLRLKKAFYGFEFVPSCALKGQIVAKLADYKKQIKTSHQKDQTQQAASLIMDKFVGPSKPTFYLGALMKNADLRMEISGLDESIDEAEVDRIIMKAVQYLRFERGVIYKSQLIQDCYDTLGFENLGMFIVSLIDGDGRDDDVGGDGHDEGVDEEGVDEPQILRDIKKHELYCGVPSKVVQDMLVSLVEREILARSGSSYISNR